MKKTVILTSLCLCINYVVFGQAATTPAAKPLPVLSKKESKQILEKVWNSVKTNDSSSFIKMWILDSQQWPYHTVPFTVNDIKINFDDFKTYFDTALAQNMKFDAIESDTLEKIDPHYDFSKYYIRAWFKYKPNYRKGFGFYMDCVNDKWYIRFSPDYSIDNGAKK